MGPKQSQYQAKPLQVLIKDVAQFNLLTRQGVIQRVLGIPISGIITQESQGNIFNKQQVTIVELNLPHRSVKVSEEQFYIIKELMISLASVQGESKEEGLCQICFDQKINNILPCGHSYCRQCVEDWFIIKDKDSCPMCRANLSKQKMMTDSYYIPSDVDLTESLKQQIADMLQ